MANKDKSLMEHLAVAKSVLVAAEMHRQVLAVTFPDTCLAGLMFCCSIDVPLIVLSVFCPCAWPLLWAARIFGVALGVLMHNGKAAANAIYDRHCIN